MSREKSGFSAFSFLASAVHPRLLARRSDQKAANYKL
jgi:hypothetical protein